MDLTECLRKKFKESANHQFHIEGDIWLVPCVANFTDNEYKPLLKPVSVATKQENLQSKKGWNEFEEEILLKIVESRGAKAWSSVAKELNAMAHEGNAVRLGKHCRERWYNHVDPNLVKGKWSEEEDNFILMQHQFIGNRWSEISKLMQGRTENSVKNRFKSLIRKRSSVDGNSESSMFDMMNEKQMEITMQASNYNALLLMSPQIINFNYGDMLNSPSEESFVRPTPIVVRPIQGKLPEFRQINEVKERLKRELYTEGTPSPSAFLRFGN